MQTWTIKGQTYTHSQLIELKKQGLDPRTDDIVLRHITDPTTDEAKEALAKKAIKNKKKNLEQTKLEAIQEPESNETEKDVETEAEEFARLKIERAWKNSEKKDRYNELKAKLT